MVDTVRLTEAVEEETSGEKSRESFVLRSLRINPDFMGSRISFFYKKIVSKLSRIVVGCLLFSGRHTSFSDYNLLYAAAAPT